jgi:CDP-diacylglycerol---serine O-phosphatidyltransferase
MATFHRRKPKGNITQFPRAGRPVAPASSESRKVIRRRGIYLLPNAFTTAALFCGFYAIVQGMNLNFGAVGWAIGAAMILDALDGRVARLTNTQSDFGAEYDSLSDMVAFGAAPALIIYEWSLRGLGKLGWLAAFVYVSGAALRLARFNTNIDVVDKRFFQGLPSPAAAAIVTGFVWVMNDLRFAGADLTIPSFIITLFAGLSMVSNSPFYSGKDINLRKSVPFMMVLMVVFLIVLFSSDPPKVFFSLFVLYGISGHIMWILRRTRYAAAAPADDEIESAIEHD